jgi:hypothetical protein
MRPSGTREIGAHISLVVRLEDRLSNLEAEFYRIEAALGTPGEHKVLKATLEDVRNLVRET